MWQDYGVLAPVLEGVMPDASQMIGETVIDLEDRWFCEEWARKTVRPIPLPGEKGTPSTLRTFV